MDPQQERYILDNAGKRSPAAIAKELGLKERKVKRFLESRRSKVSPGPGSAAVNGPVDLGIPAIDGLIASMRPVAIMAALFLAALIAKLIVLILFERSIFANLLILDMADYDKWALEIAGGKIVGDSAFNALPFYPYMLGLVYALTGHSLFAARLLQVLLGSLSCCLVFAIGRRMFNPTVGLAAFVSMLLFREFYAYEMLILPTTLGIFFYALIIALLFRALESPALWRFAALGILTGFSVLNRAYMAFLVALIPAAAFISLKGALSKRYLYPLVFLAFAFAAIAPATMHNYIASRDFVPVTAHGGINFFVGNNPRADGMNIRVPFVVGKGSKEMLADMKAAAEKEAGRPLKPSEVSSFWSSQAVKFITSEPSRFAGLLLTKLNAFFCGFDISDTISPQVIAYYVPLMNLFFLSFRWVVPFAIIGIAVTFSRKPELLISYAVIAAHTLSIMLFLVVGRYRLAIAPILIIFWAACIIYMIKCSSAERLPKLAAVALSVAVLFVYLNNPAFRKRYELNLGANYAYIGGYFLEKQEFGRAIEFFRQSVMLEPNRAEAHNMLGLGYASNGEHEEALKEYQTALRLNPGLYQAHNNMGAVFEDMLMPDKAASEYRRSLRINPAQPQIKARLDAVGPGASGE